MIRRRHLLLLCCPADGQSLRVATAATKGRSRRDATVQCTVCEREYPVEDGVLRLLCEQTNDDAASAHERQLWDLGAEQYDERVTHGRQVLNAMEIPPTLAALGDIREKVVLELGCGTGRLSTAVASRCRDLVAVDFSGQELRILSRKLGGQDSVGVVLADVTRPCGAPRTFDVILSSQVVQALPSRGHRMQMFKWAAEALSDGGRFVFTTYHHGLRNRMFGIARSARYTEGGIFRYYSTMSEIKREIAPFFDDVRVRPIQVMLPGTGRLRIPPVALSRVAERVPGFRQFGVLLLIEAKRPFREPEQGRPSMAVESGLTVLRRRFIAARERRDVAARS